MTLTGKTAIVTGGGTGIGESVSLKLAARGVNVIVNYSRSRAEAEHTAARCAALGVKSVAIRADVADDADCRRLAADTLEVAGGIDILVNNAGTSKFARHSDLEALSGDDYLAIYRINVVGAYQMIRAVTPPMKRAGWGAIVNVSSIAGLFGIGSSSAYASSKGALITLTKSMARALAPEIRVNAICPGFVGTRWFRDRMSPDAYTALVKRVEAVTPLAHAGTADEVADGVLFFCAEGAALVTGETLLMDAGAHLDLMLGREA
jgi:3-oxoacyl-[acyl-carrier protein] reductase